MMNEDSSAPINVYTQRVSLTATWRSVIKTHSIKYTKKNCAVKFMTHCIAGEIGGVF